MRKALLATTAFAFAGAMGAGPASAADMLSLGVGGYMEQWVGYANRDDKGADGGFDSQSDSEIHFRGSLESDSGLKFTVHVELEANNDGNGDTEIDESFARMSGDFGTLELGQRDPIHARTHYAAAFGAGIGLNAGDTQKWIPGSYLETAGWTGGVAGDDLGIIYITPRVNGVQVGLSYHPDSMNENAPTTAPAGNDDAVVAAGVNFNETIGDMSFKVSLGHLSRSQSAMTDAFDLDQDNEATDRNSMRKAEDDRMKGFDNATYTNAGLAVGMGAFTFSASYATRDGGGYMHRCYAHDGDGTADFHDLVAERPGTTEVDFRAELPAIENGDMIPCDGDLPDGYTDVALVFDGSKGASGADAVAGASDINARHMIVEDESGNHDTWAVGIMYTDGPMTVSVGHMTREQEDGVERTATMVSAGYKLAPGVDWKSSIFTVDDDSGAEGTAFVTGLDLAF